MGQVPRSIERISTIIYKNTFTKNEMSILDFI